MKIEELQKRIKAAFDSVSWVNSVYFGNPYFNWNNSQPKYFAVNIEIQSITTRSQLLDVKTRIACGDRLPEGEEQRWRTYDNASNAIQLGLFNFTKKCKADGVIARVQDGSSFTPFNDSFADAISGVWADVTFVVNNEIDECDI